MKIAAAMLLVLSIAPLATADVRVTPRVRMDAVPLFRTAYLEANTEDYVRVRARMKPHASVIVWPWDSGLVSTNANFTFSP